MELMVVLINFIEPSGNVRQVRATPGSKLKDVAIDNLVSGVVAECGGACSCATCHVYIEEGLMDYVGLPVGLEAEMLELAFDVRRNSRLSCQIAVTEEMNGMKVGIPTRQS